MNDEKLIEKLSELNATQREILANQSNQQKLLDSHTQKLEKYNETLLRNTITVEEHHKRSLTLESEIKRIDTDIAPIKTHVNNVKNLMKSAKWALGILLTLIATVAAVYEAFK